MRRGRRSLYLVVTLILLALFFAPRPLFKPDWQGAIEQARTTDDCDAVNRIMFAAFNGHLPGMITAKQIGVK